MQGRSITAVIVLALAASGCDLKLKATPKGFKPGSGDTVIVHVVSEKDADLTCDGCDRTKVPASGEVDLEIKVPRSEVKKVFINGEKGWFKAQVIIDLATSLPPNFVVTPPGG